MNNEENDSLEQIQSKMQNVRRLIEEDVDDFVESTKKLTDWKHYVRDYPFASLAAAAVAGYILMPEKKRIVSPDSKSIAKLAKQNKLVVQSNPSPQASGGLASTLFGLASSMVVRGLVTYIGNQVGKVVAEASDQQTTQYPIHQLRK